MTREKLTEDDLALLEEVVRKRATSRSVDLLERLRGGNLSNGDRASVCEYIAAEVADVGVGEDFEPTPHGLRLERLLDIINRPRIQR